MRGYRTDRTYLCTQKLKSTGICLLLFTEVPKKSAGTASKVILIHTPDPEKYKSALGQHTDVLLVEDEEKFNI